MKKITPLTLHVFIFLFSLVVLGVSFYLQYAKGFAPCPLCMMQRFCMFGILILGAINLYPRIRGIQSRLIVQGLLTLLGLFFSMRQLWLLSLPSDEIPACLPGLTVLIHYFPWQETARALFWGSGDCTEIKWTFLGLSLPLWSTVYFCAIFISSSLAYYKQHAKLTARQ